jgi:cytochrome bd-type quinol oxidase subunit 2
MVRLLPWFIVAATFVAGWYASKRHSKLSRKAARFMPVMAALILCVIAVTGWFPSAGNDLPTHRWAGHALVILAWLSVPFAMGVLLQQEFRKRPTAVFSQAITFVVVFCIVSLTAFTGYLGPSNLQNVGEETLNRFKVLHLYVLPAILLALLVQWWWYFRPNKGDQTETVDRAST